MQCNKCNSANTQKLQVVYESGTSNVNSKSNTTGVGIGGGSLGVGIADTKTKGTVQTMLAKKVAPPLEKTHGWAIFSLLIGLWLCYCGVYSLACIIILPSVYFIYTATMHNQKIFPLLYKEWQESWYCNKCGNIYQESINSNEFERPKNLLFNCSYCNSEISAKTRYCPSCGAQVENKEDEIKEIESKTENLKNQHVTQKRIETSNSSCLKSMFVLIAFSLVILIAVGISVNNSKNTDEINELNRIAKSEEDKNKYEEKKSLELKKNLNYFNQNTSKVLAEANEALEAKEFEKVISISTKYLHSGNSELQNIHGKASFEIKNLKEKEALKKLISNIDKFYKEKDFIKAKENISILHSKYLNSTEDLEYQNLLLEINKLEVEQKAKEEIEVKERLRLANINNTGIWVNKYFVDNFGDKTTTRYIGTKDLIKGTFSNSATEGSALNVYFMISSATQVDIQLFEYGRNNPVKAISLEKYSVLIKDDEGNKYSIEATNRSDRLNFNMTDSKVIHKILLKGGRVQFWIKEIDNQTSEYKFNIEKADWYENAYKKLIEN